MSAKTTRPAASAEFGLPPRPPTASTPLWEHLMKNKGSSAPSLRNMPLIAPPSGPLDKNATSMKVLLHDTQVNFEKFGKHAADLIEEAKTTRHEIKTVHTLFQRDRECLMGDIIDLGMSICHCCSPLFAYAHVCYVFYALMNNSRSQQESERNTEDSR